MIKKYAVIIGIIISSLLLLVSSLKYPGGSQYDKFANGFDWKHNYICNLFDEFAVNGDYNASRYWAIAGSGMLTHTITNERLARRGYYDISEAYKSMHSI